MSFRNHAASLSLLALAFAGCGEPPRVVNMMPPGSRPDILPEVAKTHEASSLGESNVAPALQPGPRTEIDVPLYEQTAPGEEKTLESGLKYTTIEPAPTDAAMAKGGNLIEMHYIGRLEDGTIFDESRPRGAPYIFTLGAGEVIEGWDQGVPGMRLGEVRKLVIPPELGYGSFAKEKIPPNSTLIFEVELVGIKD